MTMVQYIAYAGLSVLLCVCSYKVGFVAGKMDALMNVIEWVIDIMRIVWHDQSPDDPTPEEVREDA